MSANSPWKEASDVPDAIVKRVHLKGKVAEKIDEAPWATVFLDQDQVSVRPAASQKAGDQQQEWIFAVRRMQSKMAIGMANASSIPRRGWDDSRYSQSTWFWSSNSMNGYLAQGNMFIRATPATFARDSYVVMSLDVAKGILSFSLIQGAERRHVGSLEGLHGNVVPAIGLQTEGDSVEVAPSDEYMTRSSTPTASSAGRRSPVKDVVGGGGGGDETVRSVPVQTSWGRSQKACFYGHASSIWQVERLLQDAEADIASVSKLQLFSLADSNSVAARAAPPVSGKGALTRAHAALAEAKASLFTSLVPHHQLKVVNLWEGLLIEDVEALFGSVCKVVCVALKTDSDFLHPRDRGLTAAGCGRANLVAFVTVNGSREVAKAMSLDGKEVHGLKMTVTEMIPSPLEAAEVRDGAARRERTYASFAKLQGQLRRWVRELEATASKAVEAGLGRLERGDVEGAKVCLERAKLVAEHLPHPHYTGALERVEGELQEDMRTAEAELAEEKRGMRERSTAEMERELSKLRALLEARGELRESLQAQLRERREELERQAGDEEARLVRHYQSSQAAARSKIEAAKQALIATRIQHLEHRIATAYPALSFSSLKSLMQRLEWLLDDAEKSIRAEAKGGRKTGLVDAWEGVQVAKALASSPLPHADVAALLPPPPPEMDHPTLEKLHEFFEELHVPLHLQPDNARLLREIQVLTTRLNNLEGRCKLEFHPYRQEANDAVADCAEHLQRGDVLAANQILKRAVAAAGRVPAIFHPRDLEILRQKVEGMIIADNDRELQNYHDRRAAHAPAFQLFLAFDCDYGSEQIEPPATPPELPGRVLGALSRLGWRVLHEPRAPSEIKSKSGLPGKGMGLRLLVEVGDEAAETLEDALPSLLAKDVSALLSTEKSAGPSLPTSHASPVHPNRFQVTCISPSEGGAALVDVRVLSRQAAADPHTSLFIANAVFRAVEHHENLLSSPLRVRSCHNPFGTLCPHGASDFEGQVRAKIQQCWAAVVVVTNRFYARAQKCHPGTSKAGVEAAEAAAVRGSGRVIALVQEELGPPATWGGALGKAIGECPYVMFSAEKSWDSVVEALHNKILCTGIAAPSPHADATTSSAAHDSSEVHGKAIGPAAFVSALKHCRPPGPGSAEGFRQEGGRTSVRASAGAANRRGLGGSSLMRSLALSRNDKSK